MKSCFVSIPFGRKRDPFTGAEIDFDRVYFEVVKPALEAAGLSCTRGDDLEGILLHKELLTAILGSDVMVADITTLNPNVIYDLGIRHTARRGFTIILSSHGSPVPFSLSHLRRIIYDVEHGLSPETGTKAREQLTQSVVNHLSGAGNDSALYEFFPDLSVTLPKEVSKIRGVALLYPERFKRLLTEGSPQSQRSSQADPVSELKELESEARGIADVDPLVFVDILKRYRDLAAWSEVVRLAESLPPSLRQDHEVVAAHALALNRMGGENNRQRAITLMKDLVERLGGDAESYGILGLLYKDHYRDTGHKDVLRAAIDAYRQGFEKDPRNYYTGLNACLLLVESQQASDQDELKILLPAVRQAVADAMRERPPHFWDLSAALLLASIARDWNEAQSLAEEVAMSHPSHWLVETTLRELAHIGRALSPSDKQKVEALRVTLSATYKPHDEG